MVPLMILLARHEADNDSNGPTLPKHHVAPHFDHLDPRSAVLPLTITLTSCDADTSIM